MDVDVRERAGEGARRPLISNPMAGQSTAVRPRLVLFELQAAAPMTYDDDGDARVGAGSCLDRYTASEE
jgi:hypothetical protein